MKTALSIPDDVLAAAERKAKKLGISRSEFFTRAVKKMLNGRKGSTLTRQINRVLKTTPSRLDARLARIQSQSLADDKW